ncbi:MAG: hypothetical protein Q4D35_05755 [Ruminococcus sp.]|nr:hypothetical protein [Ruminococcus sp.]
MRKKSIRIIATVIIIMLTISGCSKSENSLEHKLAKQEQTTQLRLDNTTTFRWDSLCFIAPYMSKEEIEKELSIKSEIIEDNYYDESIIYILFICDNKIVYKITGNPANLGFDFDIGKYQKIKKLSPDECVFSVINQNDFVTYKLKE